MKSAKRFVMMVPVPVLVFLFAWAGHRMTPESAPVARGAAYAEVRDCVGCHGDPKNSVADANHYQCSNTNKMTWHPAYDVECKDVMAYFETVRLRRNFDDRAQNNMRNNIDSLLIAGEQLVRKYHCFQCHGHFGQGGFKNAKSFKGYVPGYFGNDFKVLTNNADPASVREWIMHGMDSAILQKPITGRIAEFFFSRQAVNMPSYKSLKSEEIEILVNYVIALNQFGPMTAKTVRLYAEQSQSTERFAGSHNSVTPKTLKLANQYRP